MQRSSSPWLLPAKGDGKEPTLSTRYPVEALRADYPAAREPELKIRVVPNESMFGAFGNYFGDLVQGLIEEGQREGISVELDTSDRTRPNELRGGASPMPLIALAILSGAAEAVASRLLDRTAIWVRQHLSKETEAVSVVVYSATGEELSRVKVERGAAEP